MDPRLHAAHTGDTCEDRRAWACQVRSAFVIILHMLTALIAGTSLVQMQCIICLLVSFLFPLLYLL